MSKDTDIIASSHNIKTICPELNQQQILYLYREIRDLLRKPENYGNGFTDLISKDDVEAALSRFFGIEGNAV